MSKNKKKNFKKDVESADEIPDKVGEELRKQCEEYKAGWMRAQADYQNLQKEIENKRSEWVKMSEVQILEEFIPVYGNFKKAFNHEIADGQWDSWKQGIEYIMKQFGDILNQYDIKDIQTVGEEFNPEFHEAMGEEESDEVEVGKIIREVEGGYKIGEKVIKCAKVIVSK